ncbi:biotin--[acetyl-CoA-carboxylase] ligase [Chromobacterium aquaticum]|uniref:Bifunctional ligase/repressor BirA n=1 Tax=Chromobacterium aquaticum TaxID=467180 RepID=A0ABV8ZXS4_9NEIS|nr:biotin--[acetyl-CoA-carboxylase] ligase [Chromobacterium aquaticum]
MSEHAFAVLRRLADGRFHSGEDIARELDCSRTLVWQAVHSIQQDLGVTVFSVRGQGYRLETPFQWLDVADIRNGLDEVAADTFTLAVAERTDSTNTQLLARAASGGLHGLVLATELQTSGRGRLGRRWQARLGSGLTFSLLWRFERGLSQLAGLSLAVGVALARALRRLGAPVALKWPNDVLLNERKLAGILIELSGDALGPTAVVIGIGMNVSEPGDVDQPVACLADAGVQLTRSALLAELLNELHLVLGNFDRNGFVPLREEWMGLSAHQDAPVCLRFSHGEPVEGVARGVADSGALMVETTEGMKIYHAGEVSLRKLA